MRLWLKKLREHNKLSQQQVAEKLNITRQYYQQIEAGDRQQKMDMALSVKLSELFNISISDIVTFEKEFKEETT